MCQGYIYPGEMLRITAGSYSALSWSVAKYSCAASHDIKSVGLVRGLIMDEIQEYIKYLPERPHLPLAHVPAFYPGFFCNGKNRLQLPANLMVLRKAPGQGDVQPRGTTVLGEGWCCDSTQTEKILCRWGGKKVVLGTENKETQEWLSAFTGMHGFLLLLNPERVL